MLSLAKGTSFLMTFYFSCFMLHLQDWCRKDQGTLLRIFNKFRFDILWVGFGCLLNDCAHQKHVGE